MRSPFHYVRLRAHVHETEDVERVKEAIRKASQFPNVEFEEEAMEGSHGNRIRSLEADVKANPRIQALFGCLWRDDPEGARRLVHEVPRRVDENGNFYFRLDKQEAFMGRVVLAQDDDAIHVRGKLRSAQTKQPGEAQDLAGFLVEIGEHAKV